MTYPATIPRCVSVGLLAFLLHVGITADDRKADSNKERPEVSSDSGTLTFRVPVQEVVLHILATGGRELRCSI